MISMVFESITEFTIGLSYKARDTALIKKDMIPNFTPYFF